MSSSAHFHIVSALLDLLSQGEPMAGGAVYRNRRRAGSSDEKASVVVRLEHSRSGQPDVVGAPVDWITGIAVECYARGSGDAGEVAADGLVAEVFSRIEADLTLAGVAQDVQPAPESLSWDFDELDEKYCCITARFIVFHTTQGRSLQA